VRRGERESVRGSCGEGGMKAFLLSKGAGASDKPSYLVYVALEQISFLICNMVAFQFQHLLFMATSGDSSTIKVLIPTISNLV
jgi:hypothetical protein